MLEVVLHHKLQYEETSVEEFHVICKIDTVVNWLVGYYVFGRPVFNHHEGR